MHFCGNPLHDVPIYVLLGIPFLGRLWLWLKARRNASLNQSSKGTYV